MATTTDTTTTSTGTTGTGTGTTGVGLQTGTESSLSNWAGPYVTDMLGKGEALANAPYQTYQGPLTAGASGLQTQAFQGLAGLTVPQNMGTFTPQSFTDEGVAQKYMNPYLQASLDPQIAEAKRQADIQRVQTQGQLTKAGAYGGGRQAIMESEGNRNLQTNLAGITGAGYKQAYDSGMGQFNIEQGREQSAQDATNQYGLAAIQKQADLGGAQRAIEGEGVAADKAQFEEQRDFPYKQVQFQQSLLQGLPTAAQTYSYSQPSALSNVLSNTGGVMDLYKMLFPNG